MFVQEKISFLFFFFFLKISFHTSTFVPQVFHCYVSISCNIKFDLTVVVQEFDHYPFQTDIKYNPCLLITPHGGILVNKVCPRSR